MSSPLAKLVLCMVVLAAFGTLIGGLHWYSIDRPVQLAIQLPENTGPTCNAKCQSCITRICEPGYKQCLNYCYQTYPYGLTPSEEYWDCTKSCGLTMMPRCEDMCQQGSV